ncbi:co-chaperonin GroES [uncultured Caudovirales phage]|uniref:Co-chaperonin GroES n=1 Tax=uncultured Caudovirales phage TaxID=2100421 RepID=A0A6J7WBE4_9CAUD|nr:co-chaperonin GroES [uncultured Caudovirales phage]
MKALQNCVIIERDVEKHPLFVIPETEKMETGVAVAIGPQCLDIKVGDHVYFGVGQEFKQDGKMYVVMREPHILGVLDE